MDEPIPDSLRDHFLHLYAVALVDLRFDPSELEFIYDLGMSKGISKDEIDKVILRPTIGSPTYPESFPEQIEWLYDFASLIVADEEIAPEERRMLGRLCTKFGFSPENATEISDFLLRRAKSSVPFVDVLKEAESSL